MADPVVVSKFITLTNSYATIHIVTSGYNILAEKIRASNGSTAGTIFVRVARTSGGTTTYDYLWNGSAISANTSVGLLEIFGERFLAGDVIEAKAVTTTDCTLHLSGQEYLV